MLEPVGAIATDQAGFGHPPHRALRSSQCRFEWPFWAAGERNIDGADNAESIQH
ncbi:hypothetical protein MMB19_11900 [Ralstonia insidiosa]|jgi:hypothetical protein|nr:hypothetical protein MMB19_11900 [Ralstonia insidiosa]